MPSSTKTRTRLFLRELRRRRVFRVAGVYVVACWITWQVADVLTEAFVLPDWTLPLAVVLSVLGFPLAMVLGWAYDLEPEGLVKTPPARGERNAPVREEPVRSDGPGEGQEPVGSGEPVGSDDRERWARLQDHFQRLIDEAPETRAQYLDRLGEEEAGVRSEVEALLEAHDSAGPLDDLVEWLGEERKVARLQPGSKVAQYRLGRRLGGGGMGVVYEALDERLDRRVALKFLAPEISASADAAARFRIEAKAAATLDHPNVCTILQVGEDARGSLFLAMPYYDGETLRSRIRRGAVDVDEALRIVRQIADGLGAAHRRGIVHRDIKPANVMLTADGVVKILDFGVAKMADAALTRTGAALGSLSYMSPEQTRGDAVDHRTDLWSLGVVLFEMVTGRRPFLGRDEHAIRTAILSSSSPSVLPDRPDAAPILDPMLQRMLDKEREGRYGSAAELIADIDSVLAEGVPQAAVLVRPILPAGERRICSIVSTRLDPYEQLVEELGPDELRALAHRIETAIAEVVTRAGGVVLRSEGSRYSAAFGIPMTNEDDGRRSLCAALAIRERIREIGGERAEELGIRLTSRIGVDSGYVVVRKEADAVGYEVAGRPLRISQELARRAAHEEILVTSECRRLAANGIETGATVDVDVTDEEDPVSAHALLAVAPERGTLEARAAGGLTGFRGREAELSTLSELADGTAAGKGHLVQIVGPPGVGKSRLVLEFANRLDRSRFRVLTGHARPVSRSTSYAPIAEILRRIVREDSAAATKLDAQAVVDRLLDLGGDLRGSIPMLLRLLALSHPEHPFPKQLTGDLVRAAIVESVAGLFSLLAEERPLVLVFEDWHWADDASTAALRQLAQVAPSFSILVVVTLRSGYGVDLHELPGLETIAVDPLGQRTSAELLGTVLGAEAVEQSLAEVIVGRTGGNPFYIEEFGADLLEQGVVTVSGNTARLTEGAKVRLPDSVQAVIRTRLDRTDPFAKQILFAASVIGRDFSRSLLADVADETEQLDSSLEVLKASGLIQQTRVLPEPVYRFKHALTLEVTYESLLAHQRRTIHRRVAEALEVRVSTGEDRFDVLAHHFANARAWARAMPFGIEAARRSVELNEYEGALGMLEQVTEGWAPHVDPSEETDQLLKEALFMTELVLDRTGRRQAQQSVIDRLGPVVERVGNPGDELELQLRQGDLFAAVRRYDDAERVLARTLERSRQLDDPEMQRKALRSLGMAWWYQDDGRESEVLALLEEALALDLKNGDVDGEIGDRANICTMLLAMGDFQGALEVAETLRELARADHVASRHLAHYHLARCHRALGNTELALELLQEGTTHLGPGVDSSFARSTIAGIQLELGQPEKALEEYDLIVEEARRYGLTDALALTLRSSAEVLAGLDRRAEAVPLLEEAQDLFGALQDGPAEAAVSARLASLYREEGRVQDAVAAWGTVRQLARRQGDEALELDALEGLAVATREHFGGDDLAVPLYEEAAALAESLGDRASAVRMLNSLGVISWNRGDLEAARVFYERALAAPGSESRTNDTVLLLASLGAVHRKSGGLDEAVTVLEEAVALSEGAEVNPVLHGYALGVLGDVLLDKKNLDGAEEAYLHSLALRRRLEDERGEAWMLVKLSDVEEKRGALDRVREFNSRAYEIASRIDDEELLRASTARERY